MTKHVIIPDVQAKVGTPTKHLIAAGNLIAEIQPEVVVCLGDFADMQSLSSYETMKDLEGMRLKEEYRAVHRSMDALLSGMRTYNDSRRQNRKALYKPRMVLTLGNHEDRITRAINKNPQLEGVMSLEDLKFKEAGWSVYPFLNRVEIDGIHYSHYFTSKLSGRCHPSSRLTLMREHVSCTQGHRQVFDYEMQYRGDGSVIMGLTVGSFYMHDEKYKGEQGNDHWRGMVVKHNVSKGNYDLQTYSIESLLREYY